jgi:hypothetical protein
VYCRLFGMTVDIEDPTTFIVTMENKAIGVHFKFKLVQTDANSIDYIFLESNAAGRKLSPVFYEDLNFEARKLRLLLTKVNQEVGKW